MKLIKEYKNLNCKLYFVGVLKDAFYPRNKFLIKIKGEKGYMTAPFFGSCQDYIDKVTEYPEKEMKRILKDIIWRDIELGKLSFKEFAEKSLHTNIEPILEHWETCQKLYKDSKKHKVNLSKL